MEEQAFWPCVKRECGVWRSEAVKKGCRKNGGKMRLRLVERKIDGKT